MLTLFQSLQSWSSCTGSPGPGAPLIFTTPEFWQPWAALLWSHSTTGWESSVGTVKCPPQPWLFSCRKPKAYMISAKNAKFPLKMPNIPTKPRKTPNTVSFNVLNVCQNPPLLDCEPLGLRFSQYKSLPDDEGERC